MKSQFFGDMPEYPEPTQWTGDDLRPMPSVDESAKERDWSQLEAMARDFVRTYGAAAMLRCVANALPRTR